MTVSLYPSLVSPSSRLDELCMTTPLDYPAHVQHKDLIASLDSTQPSSEKKILRLKECWRDLLKICAPQVYGAFLNEKRTLQITLSICPYVMYVYPIWQPAGWASPGRIFPFISSCQLVLQEIRVSSLGIKTCERWWEKFAPLQHSQGHAKKKL